jgi:prepilin-type N-terminal cleavage/methylation domain-containing protein
VQADPPGVRTALHRIYARAQAEDGFTLIEVLASAVIVVLLSASAMIALGGVARNSYDDRVRSEAQALAQQNENRLRGYNINELSNLNQTLAPITLDGTKFTIKETATYVTDSTGNPSCTNPSADYLQTTSTVTWPQMDGAAPVTVTGQLTPTVGAISANNGGLAVSAINASAGGDAGMGVSLTGTSAASGTTASDGCDLFGDLPAGAYTASITPPSGVYVDGKTGQAVTSSTPDVASTTVNAGTTPASLPFLLDVPGSIPVGFADVFPASSPPLTAPATPSAPAVLAFNTNMTGVQYRLCTVADGATCPAVGNQDTNFPASDWSSSITANTLFPYTSPYSVYAGTCTSDNPNLISGGSVADQTATVTAGGTATQVNFTLPALVVKLYSGTSSSPGAEEALPAGSHLVITDTGCGVRYNAANNAATTLPAGQAALPLNASYPNLGANDTGILQFPGMPYGNYTVCYDTGSGGKTYSVSPVKNTGNGEVVSLYAGSATTGTAC